MCGYRSLEVLVAIQTLASDVLDPVYRTFVRRVHDAKQYFTLPRYLPNSLVQGPCGACYLLYAFLHSLRVGNELPVVLLL